jgi:hypothetical protein
VSGGGDIGMVEVEADVLGLSVGDSGVGFDGDIGVIMVVILKWWR